MDGEHEECGYRRGGFLGGLASRGKMGEKGHKNVTAERYGRESV